MRKYILIPLIFAFIILSFNFNTASASNCASGELYNTTTGALCSTSAVVLCPTGDLFSSVTGEHCNTWSDNSSTSVNYQFQIGARGEDVRAFQQVLKDKGFLVSGKVDGIYGPITAEAAGRYYQRYPFPIFPICPLTDVNGVAMHVCPPVNFNSPVISGVSGPQSLNVNQQGTWTVKAYDQNKGIGNLSYSVLWGDEELGSQNVPVASSTTLSPEQNATFTHAYYYSGNFTPVFTVTNFYGQSAQTSLTVKVAGISSSSDITVLSPNGGETWVKGATQTIRWQDNTVYCSNGLSCPHYAPFFDINLISYYPPCTSNVCPMYAVPAPRTIASNVSGSSYQWKIPNCTSSNPCSSNFEIGEGAYIIQVCQTISAACDSSDSYFTITSNSF